MRRILWALLALAGAVVGAGTLALRSPGVQAAVVTRIAQRRIGRDMSGLLAPDALRVLLCGTASPIPSPRRAEACTAVFGGEPFFGQDRVDLLVWRMRQHGLRRRDG